MNAASYNKLPPAIDATFALILSPVALIEAMLFLLFDTSALTKPSLLSILIATPAVMPTGTLS